MSRTTKLIMMSTAFLLLTWALPQANVTAQNQQQQQEQQQPQQNPMQPQRVDLDDLEENPSSYVGKEVTVEGEVQEVLGPRTFTMDENNWVDFDGETIVHAQSPNVVTMRENEEIEVSGTVRMFTDVHAEISREWGWMDPDPDYMIELNTRPVVIAETVRRTNGDQHDLLYNPDDPGVDVDVDPADPTARTRRGTMGQPITEAAEVASARGSQLVGRSVTLDQVTISAAGGKGYWADVNGERLFILPADSAQTLQQGDTVSIEGTVLSLPRNMSKQIGDDAHDENVYLFARTITKR